MEELITRIQRYIRELGTFKIEDVETRKVVKHKGYEIKYFDLDSVRIEMENISEYVFYKDLHQDTLVVILEVLKEYKHKWGQYDNFKNKKNG